jgi:hypothetical protein
VFEHRAEKTVSSEAAVGEDEIDGLEMVEQFVHQEGEWPEATAATPAAR